MGDKRQLVFELDDDVQSMLGLEARRLLVEAEAKSRKAKHDERQQQFQLAPAEPGPRRDEYHALADRDSYECEQQRAVRARDDRCIRAGRRQSRVALGGRRHQHWRRRHGRRGDGT